MTSVSVRFCCLSLVVTCLAEWAMWANGQQTVAPSKEAGGDHWSFQPPRAPAVPEVRQAEWLRNPIDRFVLARLESLSIQPSPEADRVTLIRRLGFDLLGLPPRPGDVNEFVNDQRPDAYERLVDRLLASPHFGERWGRHWLDVARYADSDGYEKDSPRPYAYLYRNWVIDAINRDLPFDQFTIEQLAGDLLPDATLEQKIATGFHRNTLTNKEGGVDQEEFRNKANVDRVNTTSTVWLGLTMGCCECHNHKYDPFTQREFYSLFAFFNTTQEVDVAAPPPEEAAAYGHAKRAFDEQHAELQGTLARYEKEQLPGKLAEWERGLVGNLPKQRWVVLEPVSATSSGGATLAQQPDGSIQAAGKSPATDTYTVQVVTDLEGITAFRMEALPDPNHPAKGPGRVKHGNFVLSEFRVQAVQKRSAVSDQQLAIALQNATADYSQDKYPVAHAIDGNPATGWAVGAQYGQRHVAVFETKEQVGFARGTALTFTLDQQYGTEHTIGRFRISASTAPRPVPADDIPDAVLAALRTAADQRDDKQRVALVQYFRTGDVEWQKLSAAVAEHAKKAPAPPATTAMTIGQNAAPPKTHVHIRGDFLRKGDEVQAGTPAVLAKFELRGDRPDRLGLARWLVDPANPLTARVTVNRIWQHLFGKGMVATPEDFGTRGERPSHPDLLDWLALEFAGRGWRRKELVRLIVSSATYRQSSRIRFDLLQRDPTNTLLARQTRYRLEAEVIRDLYLSASGLLSPAIGGPSVRPPQPAGVSDLTYAGSAKWAESTGADRNRRGLYTWFQRTSPYPMLTTFDSPDGAVCSVRRERSNTPLQALTLLNDTVFVECAQALARRVLTDGQTDTRERIRHAFRLCLAREPNPNELARLTALYNELDAACRANAELTSKLADAIRVDATEPPAAAAWAALARTVLNLDEFVTRE